MREPSLSQKRVVVIGGGTGVFTILTGLKKYFSKLSAVVAMSDNGGSTGVLREEFGILPPGDIRRALVALSQTDNKVLSDLFSYRFEEGNGLAGHNFGNIMIAALERLTGSFEKAVEEAGKILRVKGKVIPVTTDKSHLFAELENGLSIRGETNIDVPAHDPAVPIKHVWLQPRSNITQAARRAILDSDVVIIGPGDLYTSLVPNLLVGGVSEALRETDAVVVYVVNVMTKFGETNDYTATTFVNTIEDYLGRGTIDVVLVNDRPPSPRRLEEYKEEHAVPVVNDLTPKSGTYQVVAKDLIRSRGFVRHDSDKLAQAVREIAQSTGNGHASKTDVRETKYSLFAP